MCKYIPSIQRYPKKMRTLMGVSLGIAVIILAGCSNVPAYEQASLSRPGMLFSDSPVLADAASILSTVEPGTDDRGGASASGCTVCR